MDPPFQFYLILAHFLKHLNGFFLQLSLLNSFLHLQLQRCSDSQTLFGSLTPEDDAFLLRQ